MSVWDTYKARAEAMGSTRRQRALKHTQTYIESKITGSLSYKEVKIDGVDRSVTVLDQKEDMSLKKICSLPGEDIPHGGIVDYADSKWLITEKDANSEVYASGMMQRCNYLLKWLNGEGKIIEKWCVVEDGTKYLIGERSEDIITVGDARIAITIGKDEDTVYLDRGKRFLVDDMDSDAVLAYQITKPNKLFNVYNGKGVFRFILSEVNMTDNDNKELRIADFYNWKPHTELENEHKDKDIPLKDIVEEAVAEANTPPDDGKSRWL